MSNRKILFGDIDVSEYVCFEGYDHDKQQLLLVCRPVVKIFISRLTVPYVTIVDKAPEMTIYNKIYVGKWTVLKRETLGDYIWYTYAVEYTGTQQTIINCDYIEWKDTIS